MSRVTLRQTIETLKKMIKNNALKGEIDQNTIWFRELVREEMKFNQNLKGYTFDDVLAKALKELNWTERD